MAETYWAGPSGTENSSRGTWTGTGTMWQEISESDPDTDFPTSVLDSGYVRKISSNANEFITFPIRMPEASSNHACWGVQIGAQVNRYDGAAVKFVTQFDLRYDSGQSLVAATGKITGPSTASSGRYWWNTSTYHYPWYSDLVAWDGQPTETGDHTAQVYLRIEDLCGADKNIVRWWEAGLLWHYTTRPVTSSVTVTGNNISTKPTLNWSYSDSDGYSQSYVHYVIDTQSGLTDPRTSDTALQSSAVPVTGTSHQVAEGLEWNTTYYAYVRTGKTTPNGLTVWSPFAQSSSFTITADPPNPPSISVTKNDTYERTAIVCTNTSNRLTWNNSSFEDGTQGNWKADDTNVSSLGVVSSPVDHGNYALRIKPTGTATYVVRCGQYVSVEPGVNYSVTLRARTTTTGKTMNAGIRWYDYNGVKLTDEWGGNVSSTTSYQTVTATHNHASAAFAQPLFRVTTPGSAVDYGYIDKIGFGTTTTWYPGLGSAIYDIQRSDDGGITWADTMDSGSQEDWFGSVHARDFGVKRGVTQYYRARIRGYMSGVYAVSAWSSSASVTPGAASDWRLRARTPKVAVVAASISSNVATYITGWPHNFKVGDKVTTTNCGTTFNTTATVRTVESSTSYTIALTAGNVAVAAKAGSAELMLSVGGLKVQSFDNAITETVGAFKPIGADASVFVSSDIYLEDGTFQLICVGEQEWSELRPVLYGDDRCALTAADGSIQWMKIVGRDWNLRGSGVNLIREVSVRYVGLEAT